MDAPAAALRATKLPPGQLPGAPLTALAPMQDVTDLAFMRVIAHYGFFETPNVVAALTQAVQEHGLAVDLSRATYFVGRETFVEGPAGRMESWSESLFALLMRNARNASLYFGVPPDQVVEVGMRIDL